MSLKTTATTAATFNIEQHDYTINAIDRIETQNDSSLSDEKKIVSSSQLFQNVNIEL